MRRHRYLTLLCLSAPLSGPAAQAVAAQVPGRCGGPCATTWITEASYSRRLAGGPSTEPGTFGDGAGDWHLLASTGAMHMVTSRVGVGGVVTAGLWDEFYAGLGPRLRLRVAPDLTVDLTPTYRLARSRQALSRGQLDASVMWRDRVGLSVQASAYDQYLYRQPPGGGDGVNEMRRRLALSAGIRLGGLPGRVGILADAAALAGLFALVLITCGSGGCD